MFNMYIYALLGKVDAESFSLFRALFLALQGKLSHFSPPLLLPNECVNDRKK